MIEHKTKLLQALSTKNIKGVIEVLLSLRVNSLQISPELRKNLVYELIRNDIFSLNTPTQDNMIISLITKDNYRLLHASLSLVSIVASTLKGVIYLMSNGKNILTHLIKMTILLAKQQKTTSQPMAISVNLRFCIAILQKMSIKASLIPVFVEMGMIDFVLSKVEEHYKSPS